MWRPLNCPPKSREAFQAIFSNCVHIISFLRFNATLYPKVHHNPYVKFEANDPLKMCPTAIFALFRFFFSYPHFIQLQFFQGFQVLIANDWFQLAFVTLQYKNLLLLFVLIRLMRVCKCKCMWCLRFTIHQDFNWKYLSRLHLRPVTNRTTCELETQLL